jgi:beta-galactosidase/beta-glucuronidase
MDIPRADYPRPAFYRPPWLNLNGTWKFEFDGVYPLHDDEAALAHQLSREILVPFPYQSALSGIGQTDVFPCVWYQRAFEVPADWEGRRILLHFGAVDYHARVWLNDRFIGNHRGGHTPFSFDITPYLRPKDNTLTVRVFDDLALDQPRGKQSWGAPTHCWYSQTTGIWQTVWLEAAPKQSVESVRIMPNLDTRSVSLLIRPNAPCPGLEIAAEATFDGSPIGASAWRAAYPCSQLQISLEDLFPWTPETPNLYDLEITLREGDTVVDRVTTYFGMRNVSLSSSTVLLNDEPYYQRLVLDQGFWPDGLYTAPTDAALKADIEWAKKLGFNGCRKHMKVEDPRFLYWADQLGFLVWGEFPANYEHSLSGEAKFLPEWQAAVQRDLNHPCIIAWTPFNESWGVKDVKHDPATQRWVRDVVQQTRLIDPTRLVIDNDGWEHIESDIYGYHDYSPGDALARNYRDLIARARQAPDAGPHGPNNGREMMAAGAKIPDMPIMITEFGGIGFKVGQTGNNAWGYAGVPQTDEEFKQRYEETFNAVFSIADFCGYVYTQLTDVEQEINGLLTAERAPKFDVDWLKRVNQGKAAAL